jgi:hypothetical protein
MCQAERSRRIPVIEGLGDRRVPAALLHDVALVTASIADSRGMTIDNNIDEILMQMKFSKFFDNLAEDRLDTPPHR